MSTKIFEIVFDVAPLLSSVLLSIYLFRLTRQRRCVIANAVEASGKVEHVKSKVTYSPLIRVPTKGRDNKTCRLNLLQ